MKQTQSNRIAAGLFLLVGIVYALFNSVAVGAIFILIGAVLFALSFRP